MNTLQAEKLRDLIAFLEDNGWKRIKIRKLEDLDASLIISVETLFPANPKPNYSQPTRNQKKARR